MQLSLRTLGLRKNNGIFGGNKILVIAELNASSLFSLLPLDSHLFVFLWHLPHHQETVKPDAFFFFTHNQVLLILTLEHLLILSPE